LRATFTTPLSSSLLPIADLRQRPLLLRRPVLWVLLCIALLILLRLSWFQPTKNRRYAYAGVFLLAMTVAAIVGCSGGSSGKTASITAKYSGDTNYKRSTSPAITIKFQ
jgi:hypothetical protein